MSRSFINFFAGGLLLLISSSGFSQSKEKVWELDTNEVKKQYGYQRMQKGDSVFIKEMQNRDRSYKAIESYNIKVNLLKAPATSNPDDARTINDGESELLITLQLKDISQGDSLFIKYGTMPGLGNIADLKLLCIKMNNAMRLVGEKRSYIVTERKSELRLIIPNRRIPAREKFLWVSQKRTDGTYAIDLLK